MFVIAYGDPFDGIHLVGPFDSAEEAGDLAEETRNIRNDTWWIISLQKPQDEQEAT